ncbi:MAG: primosome assembly protein PriA [Jatrophihabitans sp.]|nr:primosome assembly protein PriA [Jatrophihabitans sp.]
MVDVPLPHLDRPFDYAVPDTLAEQVVPGARVRVRFSGRLVDAYVLERAAESGHVGTLAMIERAVGGEPVLTPETAALFRAVADRWAGNFVDVVRLGVPSRHAAAENAEPGPTLPPPPAPPQPGLSRYRAGTAFLGAVAEGRAARAVWSALPGEQWPQRLAEAVAVAAAAGRGAIVVVPDARDLARLDAAVTALLGAGRHVALSADLGPAERYRRWLAVKRGSVRVAIGTRAAAFAPVSDLGLVAIWDDGDDLYDEPRAPYAHTRDVLVLRSAQSGAALLIGGFARTAEAQQLLESGWAREIVAERAQLRAVAPRVVAVGDDVEQARDPAAVAARLPSLAWRTTREALAAGHPVLVQVPRRGYAPSLACARDRTPARCATCSGPIASAGSGAVPACRWCGRPAAQWRCPVCGHGALRAVIVGARRTAEELGRAFPGATVRTSGGDRVLAEVPDAPDLVIATPGAEPVAAAGYGAALLLDGWALLSRPDLRAGEEALRRWMTAAALVRAGGVVVVGADAGVPAVQALIRWDPAGSATRELADRAELAFPPAVRMAALTGPAAAVAELVAAARLPADAELIGPVPMGDDGERVLIRAPRAQGAELATALKAAAAGRSARKAAEPVKLVLDAHDLL